MTEPLADLFLDANRSRKKCTICLQVKNSGQFTIRSNGRPHSWCRACAAKRKRERLNASEETRRAVYERNRDARRKRSEQYKARAREAGTRRYATPKGRAAVLFSGARARARKKNEPFLLTIERVESAITAGRCERTGIAFELIERFSATGRQSNPRSPSIDKIDSFKPYSNDNVQVVCSWYNKAKEQLSDAELYQFCKIVVQSVQ